MKGDDVLWSALTIWYMTVLALCATAPPGESLFGAALQLLPASLHTWLYAPAAGLLAWLVRHCLALRSWSPRASALVSSLLALLFAGLLEWAHAWQGNRAPAWVDVGWAAMGIVVTWVGWMSVSHTLVRSATSAEVIPFRRAAARVRKGSFR